MKNSLHLPPELDTINTERMLRVAVGVAAAMIVPWVWLGYHFLK